MSAYTNYYNVRIPNSLAYYHATEHFRDAAKRSLKDGIDAAKNLAGILAEENQHTGIAVIWNRLYKEFSADTPGSHLHMLAAIMAIQSWASKHPNAYRGLDVAVKAA